MKFGATLKSSAVPEWRKAYINYSQLKKQVKKAVAEDQGEPGVNGEPTDADSEGDGEETEPDEEEVEDPGVLEAGQRHHRRSTSSSNINKEAVTSSTHSMASASTSATREDRRQEQQPARPAPENSNGQSNSSMGLGLHTASTLRHRSRPAASQAKGKGVASSFMSNGWRFNPEISIAQLMRELKPEQRKFFTMLYSELDKVSAFYNERETECAHRYRVLQDQLEELAQHRLRHEQPHGFISKKFKRPAMVARQSAEAFSSSAVNKVENFANARKSLRTALNELYKLINYLQSYKDVNRTGFSKILKKFEKATNIPCSSQFMTRVNESNFVQTSKVDELVFGVEHLYALHFTGGNKKRARDTLRVQDGPERHHFAAGRSGVFIGLAIPAFVDAIVKALDPQHQANLPQWPRLLQLYGALGQPVVFAMLFAFCLEVYRYYRINYVLIFELDIRNRIDSVQYLEMPSLLFLIYSYCFWLSFSNFWPNDIVPWAWSLVFVVATVAIILNPFPGYHVNARYWLVRRLSRVFTGGLLTVEFTDFWLGDELCSLNYTFYNFGLLVCSFNREFRGVPPHCSTNDMWASPCLASLPFLLRATQSIRRYRDSNGQKTHLINFGKYAMSIVYTFLYFRWRISFGSSRSHSSFPLWIVFAIFNSLWSLSWDVYMDWNLLKRHAKYPLLRRELVFKDQWWVYYVAVVLDVLLRFAWVLYVFKADNFSVPLRGFVTASLEVLRRVLWNFFRIESEHIGNTDGFRVTRDVPLPYIIPDHVPTSQQQNNDDDDEEATVPRRKRIHNLFMRRLNPRAPASKNRRNSSSSVSDPGEDTPENVPDKSGDHSR